MTRIEKVLYTGKTHTTGGRDGASRSSDGRLDIKLSSPGTPGSGTNPEQLFAAGWSACFIGAMGLAAREMKVKLAGRPGRGRRGRPGHHRRRLLPPGSPQRQPAGSGARGRAGPGGRRAPDLPVFQGHPGQHRRHDQAGLSRRSGLPVLIGQAVPIRTPTGAERAQLEPSLRARSAFTMCRAPIVLLSASRQPPRAIAAQKHRPGARRQQAGAAARDPAPRAAHLRPGPQALQANGLVTRPGAKDAHRWVRSKCLKKSTFIAATFSAPRPRSLLPPSSA
jgi:hypothetical protein